MMNGEGREIGPTLEEEAVDQKLPPTSSNNNHRNNGLGGSLDVLVRSRRTRARYVLPPTPTAAKPLQRK